MYIYLGNNAGLRQVHALHSSTLSLTFMITVLMSTMLQQAEVNTVKQDVRYFSEM